MRRPIVSEDINENFVEYIICDNIMQELYGSGSSYSRNKVVPVGSVVSVAISLPDITPLLTDYEQNLLQQLNIK